MSRRHQTRTRRRLLSMETLEGRRLLVAGPLPIDVPAQNFADPEDTNNDGHVSPADALSVINALNDSSQSGSPSSSLTDVDGNGIVTPRDALLVINRLNSNSDKSQVSPQERAASLQKALDAGYVPPNMSATETQELLETLENGGYYEAGERYRDGQMINVKSQSGEIEGVLPVVEAEGSPSIPQAVGATSENLIPATSSPQMVDEEEPFALLDSADEALSEPLYDSTLWNSLLASTDVEASQYMHSYSSQLAELLASENAREQFARSLADALESGDKSVEDIVNELEALRATLGDAHSQISQLFANLDIDGIIEQLGVDLGTLAQAVLSHDLAGATEREVIIGEFLGRDYLYALDVILP